MDPNQFFNLANICFVNENYDEAARNLSLAIEMSRESYQFWSHRAAAFYKMGKLSDALGDIETAIKLHGNEHVPTTYRHGQILFALGRYSEARECFRMNVKKDRNDHKAEAWERKCDAELSGATLVIPEAKVVSPQVTSNGKGAQAADQAPASPTARNPIKTDEPQNDQQTAMPQKATPQIKHSWYQNDSKVFVSIFVKNRQKDDVTINFEKEEISCSVALDKNEDFLLELTLCGEIVPESCKFDVGKLKIEIELLKAQPGVHWNALEQTEVMNMAPSYPTSNKKKANWQDMDRICQKEIDQDKPEGDEALNTLFREIYGNANEETRRAMTKSFQTSGGTVLSTNWDEVGKADYEGKDRPSPPEGQMWAK